MQPLRAISVESTAAAAKAHSGTGGGVLSGLARKDVVELLHSKKRMSYKELKKHFSPFLKSKDDTAAFVQLMKDIAVMDNVGNEKIFSLKDSTKYEFHLEDDD